MCVMNTGRCRCRRRPARLAAGTGMAFALMLALAGCGGGAGSGAAEPGATGTLSAQALLGAQIFEDVSLSASGRQVCISCHDASHGHAAPNALPAQLGGPVLGLQGGRTAPGIRYLASNHSFRIEADGTPTGGFFWDDRANSLLDQADGTFLNPVEMANGNVTEVVRRLAGVRYAQQFRQVFGADIFDRPDDAFDRMALALHPYQLDDADFRPFSSKFDALQRGRATLADAERRKFNDLPDALHGYINTSEAPCNRRPGDLPALDDAEIDDLIAFLRTLSDGYTP